jgi:hypothetical protein
MNSTEKLKLEDSVCTQTAGDARAGQSRGEAQIGKEKSVTEAPTDAGMSFSQIQRQQKQFHKKVNTQSIGLERVSSLWQRRTQMSRLTKHPDVRP